MATPPAKTDEKQVAAEVVDPIARFRSKATENNDSLILNAEPGWQYTYFQLGDFKTPVEIANYRRKLKNLGYSACNGPEYVGAQRNEVVASHGDAEIWRRDNKTRDAHWLSKLVDCVLNKTWAEAYWRHQFGLPVNVATAMFAFHELQGFKRHELPNGIVPLSRDQLVALVWDQVPVHPGGSKTNPYAWGPRGAEKK